MSQVCIYDSMGNRICASSTVMRTASGAEVKGVYLKKAGGVARLLRRARVRGRLSMIDLLLEATAGAKQQGWSDWAKIGKVKGARLVRLGRGR